MHYLKADIVDGNKIVPLTLKICNPDSRAYAVWAKSHWEHKGTPQSMTLLMVS
jgi:hypothetical protein